MEIILKEPNFSRFAYINPKTNKLHLLMPVMGGTGIGLDNTCQTLSALKEFWGLKPEVKGAMEELCGYKEGLEYDLKVLSLQPYQNKTLIRQKEERLRQVIGYIRVLNRVQKTPDFIEPLSQSIPFYPDSVIKLMQDEQSNLYSIVLRPEVPDNFLRTIAIKPVFSLNHDYRGPDNQRVQAPSTFYPGLASTLMNVSILTSKERLVQNVLAKLQGFPVNFERARTTLTETIKDTLKIDCSFNQTIATNTIPSVEVTSDYIDEQIGVTEDYPAEYRDYIETLLANCAPNLLDTEDSPFYSSQEKEQLSIATQFFLAVSNIVCRIKGYGEVNFGQVLETDSQIAASFFDMLKKNLEQGTNIEDEIIKWLELHAQRLQLPRTIPSEVSTFIKTLFKAYYEIIKDSQHFDEFMIFNGKKGRFVIHQGHICVHFVDFMQTGFFKGLNPKEAAFYKLLQDDFSSIKGIETMPHKNEQIKTKSVTIDLSRIKKEEIVALYDLLPENTQEEVLEKYPSIIQEKQAKQFLQFVASGQQKEAENMLKQDPALAQRLLRTQGIPFTDPSGRTFTCTAYAYTRWALDSHMGNMLARYIIQDQETQNIIQQCVRDMERPLNSPLRKLFHSTPEPRGLTYTQQGKTYRSAHFSFKPALSVLNRCVQHYQQGAQKLGSDLIKKVSREQHNFPAHVVNEYFNSERPFTKDRLFNEDQLTRTLQFYNCSTGAFDDWFTCLSLKNQFLIRAQNQIVQCTVDNSPTDLAGHIQSNIEAFAALEKARLRDIEAEWQLPITSGPASTAAL